MQSGLSRKHSSGWRTDILRDEIFARVLQDGIEASHKTKIGEWTIQRDLCIGIRFRSGTFWNSTSCLIMSNKVVLLALVWHKYLLQRSLLFSINMITTEMASKTSIGSHIAQKKQFLLANKNFGLRGSSVLQNCERRTMPIRLTTD
jgi:hypothetical protein